MATRSNINVKIGDVYHSVYCHFDGYPEGVGKTLVLHYNSQELAEELIKLGNISSIGEDIESTEYYGRDRGEVEENCGIHVVPLNEEEYCYAWSGTDWRVTGWGLANEPVLKVLDIKLEEHVKEPEPVELSEAEKVFKYYGCTIDEVIAINNEWAVTFNTPDPRMTDAYNERIRFMIRHREAPYQGMDEDGIWHHSFFGRTLYEAVSKANEYLKRGQEFESQYKDE